jgi:hypothetical protein
MSFNIILFVYWSIDNLADLDYGYVKIGDRIQVTVLGTVLDLTVVNVECTGRYGYHVPVSCHSSGQQSTSDDNPPLYHIGRFTQVKLNPNPASTQNDKKASLVGGIRYDAIGGLRKQVQAVRSMVDIPLLQPELYLQFGLQPPKGILLYGPPGTGKTLLARAVANETGAHVMVLSGAEVMSKYYGETEAKLRDVFTTARANAPTIVFIDEIDALCPKRDEVLS